jgi:hypothetical protein
MKAVHRLEMGRKTFAYFPDLQAALEVEMTLCAEESTKAALAEDQSVI